MASFLLGRKAATMRKCYGILFIFLGITCISWFTTFESQETRSSPSLKFRPRVQMPARGSKALVKAKFPFRHSPHLATKTRELPTIPHLIHQVWLHNDVPPISKKWMSSWMLKHPNWKYRFWTLEDVTRFVNLFFRRDSQWFSQLPPKEKMYVSRYFILLHFGGVFADIDVEALQALDNWTFNYNCVLSQENAAHMYLLNNQKKASLTSSIMLCQPQHQFLSKAIELFRTTPTPLPALTEVYNTCLNSSSAHAQGWQKDSKLAIVPSEYFSPSFDVTLLGTLVQMCDPIHSWQQSPKGQLLCQRLRREKFRSDPGSEAYAERHWFKAPVVKKEISYNQITLQIGVKN
ncbi:hypothetical protein CAPTEDRAFT_190991 [Capitella teleta]|uniref:Uncharacterized protein n=1 Tax=Capitella teleta TaxID=283909 RepID=R7TS29_CAPTE|nr:hypothetical protein CAPTEDRAFT_190991 [Capitella teleta]|eukprot:ELT93810.1 hypothetical protein CAPTEDRAFT_190991 [Capitella teleta]